MANEKFLSGLKKGKNMLPPEEAEDLLEQELENKRILEAEEEDSDLGDLLKETTGKSVDTITEESSKAKDLIRMAEEQVSEEEDLVEMTTEKEAVKSEEFDYNVKLGDEVEFKDISADEIGVGAGKNKSFSEKVKENQKEALDELMVSYRDELVQRAVSDLTPDEIKMIQLQGFSSTVEIANEEEISIFLDILTSVDSEEIKDKTIKMFAEKYSSDILNVISENDPKTTVKIIGDKYPLLIDKLVSTREEFPEELLKELSERHPEKMGESLKESLTSEFNEDLSLELLEKYPDELSKTLIGKNPQVFLDLIIKDFESQLISQIAESYPDRVLNSLKEQFPDKFNAQEIEMKENIISSFKQDASLEDLAEMVANKNNNEIQFIIGSLEGFELEQKELTIKEMLEKMFENPKDNILELYAEIASLDLSKHKEVLNDFKFSEKLVEVLNDKLGENSYKFISSEEMKEKELTNEEIIEIAQSNEEVMQQLSPSVDSKEISDLTDDEITNEMIKRNISMQKLLEEISIEELEKVAIERKLIKEDENTVLVEVEGEEFSRKTFEEVFNRKARKTAVQLEAIRIYEEMVESGEIISNEEFWENHATEDQLPISADILDFTCKSAIKALIDKYESDMYKPDYTNSLFQKYVDGSITHEDHLFKSLMVEVVSKGTVDEYLGEENSIKVFKHIGNIE